MTVGAPNQGQSLSASPAPAPLALAERPGLRAGLWAVFDGYKYLFRTPDLWLLAFVPALVALLCALFFGVIAVKASPLLVAWLIKTPGTSALWSVLLVVVHILVTLLLLAFSLALALALGKPLSGPALERIVRRVEADLGAPAWPEPSLLQDVWRSLQSTLVAFVATAPLLVLLSLLSFFFAPAVVITFPLQIAVTALGGAWDFCDYPLSIRGVRVSERLHFVRRNWLSVLGFGLGLALLSLLPCSLVLVVPAGVIGAARLVVHLERFEAAQNGLAR